jgi:thiamine pyrophosphokinase
MSDDTTEANARDIAGIFDRPDAEWTAEYPWTRYRGPDPWPCPGAWLLTEPEGLYVRWIRYPEVGIDHGTTSTVDTEVLDYGAVDDHRAEEAWLIGDDIADSIREETIKWTLEVDNTEVFARVEPAWDDLMAAVAEALRRFEADEEWAAVEPESGRLPPEQRRQRELEQRKASNQSLGEFGGDDE